MQKILYKTDQSNPAIRAYSEAIEKGKKNQHVLPYGNGWAVTDLISGKANRVFNNVQEATQFATANATVGTAVFIHNSNGTIAKRKDY